MKTNAMPGEGDTLWIPPESRKSASRLSAYQNWLAQRKGLHFESYSGLWRWSVDRPDEFWESVWDFFELQADGSRNPVLASRQMPGAAWYPNARLNYAEHAFRHESDQRPALIARSENAGTREVSWAELRRDTGALAAKLRALGIGPGDRVAAYLPSRPEAVVAFLACASIGAIWSGCAPDMGPAVVLDRFGQIEPKLLIACDSYSLQRQGARPGGQCR